MAPATKPQPNPQPPGVLTDTSQAPGGASLNRKKQKKRQKQAARRAAAAQDALSPDDEGPLDDNDLGPEYNSVEKFEEARQYYAEAAAQNGPTGTASYETARSSMADFDYSDGENDDDILDGANGTQSRKKKNNKKKKGKPALTEATFEDPATYDPELYTHPPPPPPPPPISNDALRTVQRGASKDPIWNNSSQEERARIKEFWLSLGENERKSLVKIERDAVLKKMKEQQKHSCSCTVCGRKRTAIEEELEVLYDAYYEELEQYANHGQHTSPNGTPMLPQATPAARRYIESMRNRKLHKGRITELPDDEEDELDELPPDEEEYSDEEYEEGVDFSGDDTDDMHHENNASDFFTFGNSLTVKAGGILTVADDLLKNDGQKFIDMMEQLAERRMQREELSAYPYNAYHTPGPPHTHPNHDHSPLEDEYEDEEDDDYDDEDDDEFEEEDEMVRMREKLDEAAVAYMSKQDQMTEEQRMEEGRRMFQIFAARMFEQRVLTAYKEKVARERQEKLIQELEADKLADTQRDAKKQRDAEKKKAKKQAQKQAKAEEKAKKDAEKAAEEAAKKDEEEKKKEEQRRKRDEARKKKDEERKAQETERQKKEAEKRERQEAERKQREEAERKVREAKIEEKKRRDEQKKKEREERENLEKTAKEKKSQADKEQQERNEHDRVQREAVQRSIQDESQPSQSGITHPASPPVPQPAELTVSKRPSLPAVVALPPGLKSRNSNVGLPSPQTKVATPVIPKAPTPVRAKEQPGRVSQNSTPLTPEMSSQSKQSTPPRTSTQQSTQASSIASRGSNQQPPMPYPNQPPHGHPIAPPPGMPFHPQQQQQPGAFGGVPGMGVNGYPGGQGPHMMHGPRPGQHMPMMPPTGQLHRGFGPPNVAAPPPGMGMAGAGPMPRGFGHENAPGFPPPSSSVSPGISPPTFASAQGAPTARHSRQQSASYENQRRESQQHLSGATQPISRPAPIKRPTSTKPSDGAASTNADADDVNKHLGSSALLDDTDEPLPASVTGDRRHSAAPGSQPNTATSAGFVGSPFDEGRNSFAFGAPQTNWRAPANNFAAPSVGPTTAGWGASTQTAGPGWSSNFGAGTFSLPHRPVPSRHVLVRILACKACQQLSTQNRSAGGVHDLSTIVRLVNELKSPVDPQVDANEVRIILDSEPTEHNGGGMFDVSEVTGRTLVKWEPTAQKGVAPPGSERSRGFSGLGIGEIGSQLSGPGMPVLGGLGGGGPRGGF